MTRLRATGHHAAHLLRRFAGSLSSEPPSSADDAWAESLLLADERTLWHQMGNQDRRHAVAVARRFEAARADQATRAEMAGALLHDVGKVEAGLGTFGRVLATLLPARWRRGRYAVYHRHETIGADWCREAGSEAVTVALVQGAGPPASSEALAALHAADDL